MGFLPCMRVDNNFSWVSLCICVSVCSVYNFFTCTACAYRYILVISRPNLCINVWVKVKVKGINNMFLPEFTSVYKY